MDTTERMRITSSGNVGIGTTSPTLKLQVDSGSNIASFRSVGSGENNKQIVLRSGGDRCIIEASNASDGTDTSLAFNTASNERMRVTSNGELLIGRTSGYSAGWLLAVEGNIYAKAELRADLRITTEQVLIGTTTDAGNKLEVWGPNNVSLLRDTSGSSNAKFISFVAPSIPSPEQIGSITRNGSASSILYNTTSDYRLKEDLKEFNALELIMGISVYDFKWKGIQQREHGVLAHELKQIIPNIVTGEKDGKDMQVVDYSKLVPILVQSIKELKTEIEILKQNK
jgi:hypothetical protein